jgi:PKD repeat protein
MVVTEFREAQSMWHRSLVVLAGLTAILCCPERLLAQPFQRGGAEFDAMRQVSLPADKDFAVVVVPFFHHGKIAPDGKNVIVSTRDQKLVATRILQLGPGDYCKLAFETARGQKNYEIFYGGEGLANDKAPAWTNNDGLLLETRVYKDCNLNRVESVREAFNSAPPIGADYVDAVSHAENPFSSTPGPFFSRYSGYLRINAGGAYGFMTSSQDCSFLLIDDKVVTEAPGAHRPRYDAPPDLRKNINLNPGAHKFEYYHAATSAETMMIAAWEPSPADAKPKPQAIPPDAFRVSAIGRAQAGFVTMREVKLVPDFTMTVAGDVPLPDNDRPLIGVQFNDLSPAALTMKSKLLWEFGDGQTAEVANPTHVYLHPGLYTVKLTIKRSMKPFTMANRVYVDRPHMAKRDEAKAHKLEDYLPIVATYDARTLDAAGLRQLVAAYQWKIDRLLAPLDPDAEKDKPKKGKEKPEANPDEASAETVESKEQIEAKRAEARKYMELAVAVGKAALVEESEATGDEDLYPLAAIVGPMARDRLGDSLTAGHIWAGATRKISKPELRAECEIEAADVAINDLGNAKAAKTFLDSATSHLPKDATGAVASRLKRVWGDYHAMSGNGEEARKAYAEAEAVLNSTRNNTERTAWQGAYSRSTEQFLKTAEWDRAVMEIRSWEREFPIDRIDGYMTLLYARYWAGRQMYPRAIALSEQLLAVNPSSAYVDQLLLVAADCEVKRGEPDRALATLHSLIKDYPGSPLVPLVKKNIAALESGETAEPKKPTRSRSRKEE